MKVTIYHNDTPHETEPLRLSEVVSFYLDDPSSMGGALNTLNCVVELAQMDGDEWEADDITLLYTESATRPLLPGDVIEMEGYGRYMLRGPNDFVRLDE